jgi:hypothetical protein
MSPNIDKLLSIASKAVGPPVAVSEGELGPREREVYELLAERNGFYAFESALHVFPSGPGAEGLSLEEWNSENLWCGTYGSLIAGHLFFAEDIFGCQFSVCGEGVFSFDPEFGTPTPLAASLEEWAGKILADYRKLTGWPLAHEWQAQHGPIPLGKRLMPAIPFICGGEFSLKNLKPIDVVEVMQARASIWTQIKDLPDGAQIRIVTTE